MKADKTYTAKTGFVKAAMFLALCAFSLLCAGSTVGEKSMLSASAKPDAYYEAFDSRITVTVTNTYDTPMTVNALNAADTDASIVRTVLETGQRARFVIDARVTDKMLTAGHFFVTLDYEYANAEGQIITGKDQILCEVRRLEDKVEARLLFALPDRPIDDDDSVLVSYILDNYGDTDIKNAVLTCYPGGFESEPMDVPDGGFIALRRPVPRDKLNEIAAAVSCQSAYSGEEYFFELEYDGSMADAAVLSEEYLKAFQDSSPTESAVEGADRNNSDAARSVQPSLSAAVTENGISINVSAGSETLTDVVITANETIPVRTLVILGKDLGATVDIPDGSLPSGDYVFALKAVLPDGETVNAQSDKVSYTAKGANGSEGSGADLLDRIADLPPIAPYLLGCCAAVLVAAAAAMLVRRAKKHRPEAVQNPQKEN